MTDELDEKGISDRIKIVDGHNDAAFELIEEGPFILPERGANELGGWIEIFQEEARPFNKEFEDRKVDFPKILRGGVNCLIFAIFVSPQSGNPQKRVLQYLDALHREFERTEGIELTESYHEIEEVINKGKVAALIALEGGHPLDGSLAVLRELNRLSVKVITLTHWGRNILGEGSGADSGAHLSQFGFDTVEEMNRQNMLIDLAHLNETGFYDVLEKTSDPAIVSHSNLKHFFDHHRNLSEEQIKALANNGGVIGLSFVPGFISEKGFDNPENVSVDDLIDQIEYVMDLVGPDHVGLGSDFGGGGGFPGLENISKIDRIPKKMLQRGHKKTEIQKIAGGNYMRVFQQVLRD